MKSPSPQNTWTATKLSENLLGANLGADVGLSGAMVVDGKQVHVHCGGLDAAIEDGYFEGYYEFSSDCCAMRVDSSGEVLVDSLAPLPLPVIGACYGSDGGRLVVAGGYSEYGDGY